jgi:dTMP kinase
VISGLGGSYNQRLIIFEGEDGAGKTTLAAEVTRLLTAGSKNPVLTESFPGSTPGTLGSWVHRLHHGQVGEIKTIAPEALQLMHVAAHVDLLCGKMLKGRESNSTLVLDRFWWSTYAYSRFDLEPEGAWGLVNAELPFWKGYPVPDIVFLTRQMADDQLTTKRRRMLRGHYREVIDSGLPKGRRVHEIENSGTVEETMVQIVAAVLGSNT